MRASEMDWAARASKTAFVLSISEKDLGSRK